MSQSWDNVASMHDQYMLTKYGDIVQYPAVPYACADGSNMNFESVPIIAQATPLTAVVALAPTECAMATFSLCSNVATGLLTCMTKKRPRLSLPSRLSG